MRARGWGMGGGWMGWKHLGARGPRQALRIKHSATDATEVEVFTLLCRRCEGGETGGESPLHKAACVLYLYAGGGDGGGEKKIAAPPSPGGLHRRL